MKAILTLAFLGALAFSVVGFLATFEPLDEGQQVLWRVLYGLVAAASAGGLLRLRKSNRGSD